MTIVQRVLSIFLADQQWFRRWVGGRWVREIPPVHPGEAPHRRPMWFPEDDSTRGVLLDIEDHTPRATRRR